MMHTDQLKLPCRLGPGDVIGIAAPAGPVDRKLLNRGLAVIKKMGFRAVVADEVFFKTGYMAGSDQNRADCLNHFFLDPTIKAILCARGGFGSLRILPLLDYDAIAQHPKILIGFSDITAILTTVYSRCGLVTFHGPMVSTLTAEDQRTQSALSNALSSESPIELVAQNGSVIKNGTATAPVLAGNLTTFCHLLATPYAPDFSGHIVIFEDIGEAPYRIDRMLTQMKLARCFEKVSGVIIGHFKDCGNHEEIVSIFSYIFSDIDIPVLSGFDIGHSRPNYALPIGLPATLDSRNQSLAFHLAATGI